MMSNSEQINSQNTEVSICTKPASGSGQGGVTITPNTSLQSDQVTIRNCI